MHSLQVLCFAVQNPCGFAWTTIQFEVKIQIRAEPVETTAHHNFTNHELCEAQKEEHLVKVGELDLKVMSFRNIGTFSELTYLTRQKI